MQTVDVVLTVLNKRTANQVRYVRRGPEGYGLLLILRLLLYSVFAELFTTRDLVRHLRKRPKIRKRLGFKKVPSRRTIDGWFEKYDFLLAHVIKIAGDRYLQLNKSEWAVLDSTPIKDRDDPDAMKGYSSQGEFWGFKIHLSCDEHRVPLRACFTTGNVHDSKPALELLAPTKNVGGDSAYDFARLKIAVAAQQSNGYFVHNPRREGAKKKRTTPHFLKVVRVCVEQCHSIVKNQVLDKVWEKIKGFSKKATRCLLGVLALQALAIYNIKTRGYPSLKIAEVRA